jgi:ornithine decarboxylase
MPSKLKNNNEFFKNCADQQTPFFVCSTKKIKDNFNLFKKYFPDSTICYAMKANSELAVLKTLKDAAASFEVASKYELNLLKKIKVSPEKIIYGNPFKPEHHTKDFYNYGVNKFAFDSLQELKKIATEAPNSKVYLRVLVNDVGSVFKFSEKFGAELSELVPLIKKAQALNLDLYGISFNVGSQAGDPKAWAKALKLIYPIFKKLIKEGIDLETINIGGGYPCNNYLSSNKNFDLQEISENFFKEYKKIFHNSGSKLPKLVLEPGRRIIADTTVLITSVISRVERRSRTWLFLDAGAYSALFESLAYQGNTRYRIDTLSQSKNSKRKIFALAGPTCDSLDVITKEILLPKNIKVGDKLVIYDVGAYNTVMSNDFNGFPKLKFYIV